MSLARSLPSLSAFLALFILARFLLDAQELAHYRKLWPFFSLMGPVVISSIVNATYYRSGDPSKTRLVLRQMATMFFLGGVAVGVSTWMLSGHLAGFFQVPELVDAYAVFGMYAAAAIWGAMTEPLFVVNNRRGVLPAVVAGFTITDLAAVLIPFWAGAGLVTVVLCMTLAQLARLLLVVPLFIRWYAASPAVQVASPILDKQVLYYAGGMAMLSLSGIGAAEIDRFIVGRYLDDLAFILYDIGARKLPFVTILTASVSSALVAGYALEVTRGDYDRALQKIRRSTTGLVRLLIPSMLYLGLVSDSFLAFVFGPSYEGSGVVFAWFLLALTSNLLFPQSLVMATGRVRVNVLGALGELLVNLSLSLVLVQDFGIAGVACASAVAHWSYTTSMVVYCRFRLGIPTRHFLPESPGRAFFALLGMSVLLALWSRNVADEWVLLFYLPLGVSTLFSIKKWS